jgi:hypothetical protein
VAVAAIPLSRKTSKMSKEQIRINFRSAHATQLTKVADAQFHQMDAAAALARERTILRDLEKQFKEDMALPEVSTQLSLDLDAKKK